MPIHCPIAIARITRNEFVERDTLVMQCAFATQNRLGRLCEERVYENQLKARLKATGLNNIFTQVPVTVNYGEFSKTYRLDLVADGAVYELKTVSQLIGEHDAQVLNYAMLLDVLCIKLLNFRNARVEGKLRLSAISKEVRYACTFDTQRWQSVSSKCEQLKRNLVAIVAEFGAFLDARLYTEALCFLCAATDARLTMTCDGLVLGTHPVNLLGEKVAFCVTSFTDALDHQQTHLKRLLGCLPLKAMQWINFNHAEIELVTLVNGQ